MALFEFLGHVFAAIGMALRLDSQTFAVIEAWPLSNLVLGTAVVLCGTSLLIGQSVILFLNRVPPPRFALSLLLNGILFGVGLLLWAGIIWLIGYLLLGIIPPRGTLVWIMCLSSAPYIFGFLVLIPWAGETIGRVLSAWSLLIALVGVQHAYRIGIWEAFVCVALGWLAVQLAQATIARPLLALRDWLWERVVGKQEYRRASDILEAFMSDAPLPRHLYPQQRRPGDALQLQPWQADRALGGNLPPGGTQGGAANDRDGRDDGI
jgi:hypothetical protein